MKTFVVLAADTHVKVFRTFVKFKLRRKANSETKRAEGRKNGGNEEEKKCCEGVVSEEECTNALKDFDNNKTPGTDGLPAEFYRFFWPDICHELLASYNFASQHGMLSISQRRVIISLIPKKSKDKTILENLRPISLLNVDYKILTKVITKRIEKVLPTLINPDQTG